MNSRTSGSQTVGPFFHLGLGHLFDETTRGKDGGAGRVTIRGRVIDGAGNAVPDAVLEIWHGGGLGSAALEPDESGRDACFARTASGSDGSFAFSVTGPGAMEADGECIQAPHIAVLVFARGLLRHLLTRMYFPEQAENLSDPVLLSIPEPRRRTLIARRTADDAAVLEWNVVLQGEDETVFFAW